MKLFREELSASINNLTFEKSNFHDENCNDSNKISPNSSYSCDISFEIEMMPSENLISILKERIETGRDNDFGTALLTENRFEKL